MLAPLRAAAVCALACAQPAAARPYTVADALRLESLGPSVTDPSGRWLIQEVQARYDRAPRFDNGSNTRPIYAHLLRGDLLHPGAGVPAFPQEAGAGYVAGPFSPSGRSMVVYRNLRRTWRIGILTIANRHVRWLAFGAEFADRGDTLAWRSDDELVALALPLDEGYYKERLAQAAMRRTPGLWRRATLGAAATDIRVGSGAFIDVHPPERPRRVILVDARSGRGRVLAQGSFESLASSSVGGQIALVTSFGRVPLEPERLISQGTAYKHAGLALLDLASGKLTTPCPDLEPLPSSLRWAPARDQLLAVMRPPGAEGASGVVTLITPRTCRALALASLRPAITLIGAAATPTAHLDWIGATPIVLASPPGEARSDWFALTASGPVNLTSALPMQPSDPIALTPEHALFLIDRRVWTVTLDGRSSPLAAPPIERILVARRPNMSLPLPQDGATRAQTIFALAANETPASLWRLTPFDASEVRAGPTARTVVAATQAGLVLRASDANGVESVQLIGRDGRPATMVRINSHLTAVDFAIPREIDHIGPSGERLKSWLYLPAAEAGAQRPPLVVMAYPGASYREPPYLGRPGLFVAVDDNVQLAVAHGYAVLVPSLPAREGATEPGQGWDSAILSIVDRVAATGLVDTERLAYWGHSFGGYVGLMLATQSPRFKAVIASAAMSDAISFRGEGWPAAWLTPDGAEAAQGWAGWTELGTQGHMMTTPWLNRRRFVDNSPVFFADQVRSPILLVHGDQDAGSIGQSREMFSDLYRLNKDALFITFYGEGHTISSPPNYRTFAQAAYAFLDRYLRAGGDPHPAPAWKPRSPRYAR